MDILLVMNEVNYVYQGHKCHYNYKHITLVIISKNISLGDLVMQLDNGIMLNDVMRRVVVACKENGPLPT